MRLVPTDKDQHAGVFMKTWRITSRSILWMVPLGCLEMELPLVSSRVIVYCQIFLLINCCRGTDEWLTDQACIQLTCNPS